jgi:hypothetical protein
LDDFAPRFGTFWPGKSNCTSDLHINKTAPNLNNASRIPEARIVPQGRQPSRDPRLEKGVIDPFSALKPYRFERFTKMAFEIVEKLATICGKSFQIHTCQTQWLPPANTQGYELSPDTKTPNMLNAWNAAMSSIPKNFTIWRSKNPPKTQKKSRRNEADLCRNLRLS